jgi:DNA-binding transcriptional ArsR family regulator
MPVFRGAGAPRMQAPSRLVVRVVSIPVAVNIFVYTNIRVCLYTNMNFETLAALGEPNRLRIVELLRAGPRPVNDIRGRLGLRQSQVSQHLKVLKDVGLVEMEPHAQQRFYRLRARPLKQLHKWLDRYRHIWEERFEQLGEIVEELKRKEKSDAAGK